MYGIPTRCVGTHNPWGNSPTEGISTRISPSSPAFVSTVVQTAGTFESSTFPPYGLDSHLGRRPPCGLARRRPYDLGFHPGLPYGPAGRRPPCDLDRCLPYGLDLGYHTGSGPGSDYH